MIGPAEIEDMRLDLADSDRARPNGYVDPAKIRQWGIMVAGDERTYGSHAEQAHQHSFLDPRPMSRPRGARHR